jgi:hypothetical protein
MHKQLTIIPLLSAILCACGDSDSNTDDTSKSHRFEGIWSAPAHGRIIEIEQDRLRHFETTESSCLLSGSKSGLSLEEYETTLAIDPETQTLSDPGINGVLEQALDLVLTDIQDSKGLIIDVRLNGGGIVCER